MMTEHQHQQLLRALDRAHAQGITIAAHGTVKATGQQFWIVNGQNDQYTVAIHDAGNGVRRLTCTCPAGTNGVVCKHTALVRERIIEQRQRQSIARQVQSAADAAARRQQRESATMPACRVNDSRAFSIFK